MTLCVSASANEQEFDDESDTNSNQSTLSSQKTSAYKLDPVVATDKKIKSFQSGKTISKAVISQTPSGNGDITSLLKIMPNVQFDNSQLKSNTPGEIDPANVSISGGLFYQNSFQLDGFNMNNDLDPSGSNSNGPNALRGGRSQGLAIDTSLLESIQVQDSNISAAYGGFSGGVIEANVRKPRKDSGGLFGWHGGLSYQFSGSALTTYFIDPDQYDAFIQSANENYQPNFSKHIIRANVEGYATDNLGILASFSTTRSFIPLKAYAFSVGEEANSTRDQHRYIDNYYIKANYNPLENLTIEASLAYAPQDNTYYNNVAKDSFYSMKSGGIQSGLKALYEHDLFLWTNSLSYSFLQNSRRSQKNYFMSWRYSADKNWASASTAGTASEGGYGDMDQMQNTLNYKSDIGFEPLDFEGFTNAWWLKSSHTFRGGFEANYTHANRDRLNPYYAFAAPVQNTSGTCGTDTMFDFETCNTATTTNNKNEVWQNGQYFNKVTESKAVSFSLDNFAYGVYGEDSMDFDFDQFGSMNVRLGLRLDGDTYMSKATIAHRLAMKYSTPFKQYQSNVIFGANRYYGRNLLSYRLYDMILNATQVYIRNDANSAWTPTTNTAGTSSYNFSKLNVPYSDEIMLGFTQNLGLFELVAKYIYRAGRDEVMMNSTKVNGTTQTTWNNEGKSDSHIITLSLQNAKPYELFSVKNYAMFALDYTKVYRSYNLYSVDDAYLNNDDIIYNGQIIKYQDRPLDNFNRPFTMRLTTTHTFNIWKTKWLLNNFFRFRSGYEAMVLLNKTDPGYDSSSTLKQYARRNIDWAFTWDIRLGFEIDAWKGHSLYVNLDIYNVLNTKNMATLTGTNGGTLTGVAATSSVIAYEIGRQFWIQGGYRF